MSKKNLLKFTKTLPKCRRNFAQILLKIVQLLLKKKMPKLHSKTISFFSRIPTISNKKQKTKGLCSKTNPFFNRIFYEIRSDPKPEQLLNSIQDLPKSKNLIKLAFCSAKKVTAICSTKICILEGTLMMTFMQQ